MANDAPKPRHFERFRNLVDLWLPALSPKALKAWLYLERVSTDDGTCRPSVATIAQRTGQSVPTTKRGLEELEGAGLVKTLRRGGSRMKLASVRQLTPAIRNSDQSCEPSRTELSSNGAELSSTENGTQLKSGSNSAQSCEPPPALSYLPTDHNCPTTTTCGSGGGDFLIVGEKRKRAIAEHGEQWVIDLEDLARLEGTNPLRFALHCLKNPDEVDFTAIIEDRKSAEEARRREQEAKRAAELRAEHERQAEADTKRRVEEEKAKAVAWVAGLSEESLNEYIDARINPSPLPGDPRTDAAVAFQLYIVKAATESRIYGRRQHAIYERQKREAAELEAKKQAEAKAWVVDNSGKLPAMVEAFRKQWPFAARGHEKWGGLDPTKNALFAAELRDLVTSGKLTIGEEVTA